MPKFKYFFKIIIFSFVSINCTNEDILQELYKKGKVEYLSFELKKAETTFKELEEVSSDYKMTCLYLGKIFFYTGRPSEALNQFNKCEKIESIQHSAKFWIIKTEFIITKDRIGLLKSIDQFIENDSLNPEIFIIQGKVYQELQDTARAIESFNRAIDIGNVIQQAHTELSSIYQKAGLVEKSQYHLGKSKSLSSK